MIPAIKKRWVKALRSGEYKQARGKLFDGKKFCCLGVLYDTEFDGDWKNTDDDDKPEWSMPGAWMIDQEETSLGNVFRVKCDISASAEGSLIDMNDEGSDFEDIAHWIDENL